MNVQTLYFGFIGILLTAVIVPFLIVIYFSIFLFSRKKAREFAHFVAKLWGRIVVSLVFIKPNIEGSEYYEPNKLYIITPNHQSAFDIFFGFRIFHKIYAFMSKDDFFKIPGVGIGMILAGYISVKRGTIGAVKSIDDVLNRLENNISVVMYPEGTRSLTGEINEPKRGLIRITEKVPNIPILPVVMDGTRFVMRPKSWKIVLGQKVNVRFLPPFYMKDIEGSEKEKLNYWYNLFKTNFEEIRLDKNNNEKNSNK